MTISRPDEFTIDLAPAHPTRVRYQVLAAACSLAVITYIHRVGFATASAEFKNRSGSPTSISVT